MQALIVQQHSDSSENNYYYNNNIYNNNDDDDDKTLLGDYFKFLTYVQFVFFILFFLELNKIFLSMFHFFSLVIFSIKFAVVCCLVSTLYSTSICNS